MPLLPLAVPLLLGFGGRGGLAVQAHDKIRIGATHADISILVVLLDFLVALFGVIKLLPDGMGKLHGLVAVAHQVGAVAAEFSVGLLVVVEKVTVGGNKALVMDYGTRQKQRVVFYRLEAWRQG